jgi:hypothetical protein
MNIFDQIAQNIIKEQQLIIGPLAIEEASKVVGLVLKDNKVEITAENKQGVIDALVARYERIFGKISHEVCRHAAQKLVSTLSANEVPVSLK